MTGKVLEPAGRSSRLDPGEKSASQPYGLVPIAATSARKFALVWIITIALCFPVYGITAAMWVTYEQKPEPAWINSMIHQKDVLLDRRAARGHRLIILGGSNALFGIDGELIERKLHVPTVNYGLHAGLPFTYMLHRVGKKMQRGDTVLLDPEYDLWTDGNRYLPGPPFQYFFTYDKRYLFDMPLPKAAGMIASIPLADWKFEKRGHHEFENLQATAGYNVGSMSRNGDIRVDVGYHPQIVTQYPFPRDPEAGGLAALRAFGAEAKAKGVRVLMTWPNYARPVPEVPPQEKVPPDWFTRQLAEDGVTVLNKPTDTAFPNEWFMDSAYHVNQCCRRVRTEELIALLRPQFGLPPVPQKPTGIFLVAGTQHRLTEGNLFADDPGVRFRYLRTEDPTGLPALTPGQVAGLVREGMPVYTDSEEAGTLLATAGLGQQISATNRVTIAQWFAKYPQHIFCLATPPDHPLDPMWKGVLPPEVYKHLAVDAPMGIVFGSGRYASHKYIISNRRDAYLQASLSTVFHQPKMLPTWVDAHAWARDGGGPLAIIWVDYGEFVRITRGIAVCAIDPGIGSVIETVTFGEGPDVETWRRYRVVESAPASQP
ncbi:MAG TPA: hypothetical protein VG269_29235 [Tepidisphaeraceae bacterium]|jgi:hypothetical protein|nr:hypothetical protein [Tepidisphaeraceae bacterium]